MKSKRLGIILLLLVTTSTIHSAEIDSSRQCDCGFQDTNTESYWTEMWHRDFNKASLVGNQLYTYKDLFVAGYQIGPKYDRTFSRIFRKENVMIANETLELAVTVKSNNTLQNNEGVLCAGFGTKRQDFLYGSFRTFMRITPTAGTVAGMFMYHPEGEIDIELLSYLKPSQSYFAIHPGITENGRASNRTHKKHKLEFDASQEFHEYRFDWYPDLAVFYIDGVESFRTTTNILSKPGRFMYNHWTDGNEKFSKGPPTTNAYLHIKNMTFFFNYSDTNNENGISRPKCQNAQTSCNIADILQSITEKKEVYEEAPDTPFEKTSAAVHSTLILENSLLFLITLVFYWFIF